MILVAGHHLNVRLEQRCVGDYRYGQPPSPFPETRHLRATLCAEVAESIESFWKLVSARNRTRTKQREGRGIKRRRRLLISIDVLEVLQRTLGEPNLLSARV